MVIKKVMLKALGNKGLEVTVLGERTVNDQLSVKRKNVIEEFLPLPIHLRQKFYRFKYFFLIMLGVWREEWSEYLLDDYSGFRDVGDILEDSGLDVEESEKLGTQVSKLIMAADTCFSNTSILGYELDETKIKIIGEYETIEGKSFKPSLPFISENDDYNFFSETYELMEEISSDIMAYIKEENIKLEDVKEMLIELNKSQDDIDRIQSQNEEENFVELMSLLKGQAIVIPESGSKLEKQLDALEETAGTSKARIASNSTADKTPFKPVEDIPDGGNSDNE